jgi:hypothetical protein
MVQHCDIELYLYHQVSAAGPIVGRFSSVKVVFAFLEIFESWGK